MIECQVAFCVVDDDGMHSMIDSEYREDKKLPGRLSEDQRDICQYGRNLLDLCQSARMRILNGRTIGDLFGAKTCYKWNGSSTVDYAIYEEDALHEISYMQVKKFVGDLSDHCAISVGLRVIDNKSMATINTIKTYSEHEKVRWTNESEEIFLKRLENEIEAIEQSVLEAGSINERVDRLTKKLSELIPRKESSRRGMKKGRKAKKRCAY